VDMLRAREEQRRDHRLRRQGAAWHEGGQDNIRTVVGAWAVGAGISLGQVDVEGKSNEITALPKLLEFLDLKGCIVTADAMGCQKEVARRAVAARADYVLAVKGNQPNLLEQVSGYLDGLITDGLEVHVSENQAHGRKEVRRCWVADQLGWMEGREEWSGLKSVAAVELECTRDGKTSLERRYFITSLAPDPAKIAHAVRAHWASRTPCTGSSTSCSERTARGRGQGMPHQIYRR